MSYEALSVPIPDIRHISIPKRWPVKGTQWYHFKAKVAINFLLPISTSQWPRCVGQIGRSKMDFYLEETDEGGSRQ